MTENKSGRQLGAEYLIQFQRWIAERYSINDWKDYIRHGKLNRTEIASECKFALSVLGSNPAIKKELISLEARLRDSGILVVKAMGTSLESRSIQAIDRREAIERVNAESRVKTLEEQNASLRAENTQLRDQLKRFQHIEEAICTTGRMLMQ